MENSRRYRRGEQSPLHPNEVFLRYKEGKEIWVAPEVLKRYRDNGIRTDKQWKKTPQGKKSAKECSERANIKHRDYRLAYYKRPEVRQRIRDRHNSKPEVIARREAQLRFREERATYRQSDEYKAILKERNRKNWLKRKALGKTRELDRRRRQNIQHRLGQNMRRLVHQALTRTQGLRRADRTFELIGCSARALSVHLEAQFTPEMSWENYGTYWEVDHALPLRMFDLRDPVQQRQAFFFENLQPLKVEDNRKKSDKVEGVSVRKIIPFKAA